MDTVYRIIDRWMNQTMRRSCSFAPICLLPDQCAKSLHCQSAQIQRHSKRISFARGTNLALVIGGIADAWRRRNARSTNARHSRFITCTAARPRPPP